ncbi:MAG TPA: HD domain-containing protein [Lacibacter sp.]|nr:HD domain-containing protein [Lacibacter sp.]HMO90204.1 HD domain-containing protein [Lacibacter sp.]
MDTEKSMQSLVEELIGNSVAASYPYHNFNHTRYVLEKAVEIATHENCSAADLRLLKAAALWHDTGYINVYQGHEAESCLLARKFLPGFGFNEEELAAVCGMIMATQIPQTPRNLLEQILADADLEYLGTDEAETQAGQLLEELRRLNPQLDETAWNRLQISFLESHRFFTRYCREYREPARQDYLHRLKMKG